MGTKGSSKSDKSFIAPVNGGCVGCVGCEAGISATVGCVVAFGDRTGSTVFIDCAAGLCGFISHALSSKPALSSLAGEAGVIGKSFSGTGGRFGSLCWNTLGSTTSLVCRGGAGRPFRVLFKRVPPGPENKPLSPLVSSALPLRFLFDREYLVLRYFITRMMSPSLSPRLRRISGVKSSKIDSSIESLLKLKL